MVAGVIVLAILGAVIIDRRDGANEPPTIDAFATTVETTTTTVEATTTTGDVAPAADPDTEVSEDETPPAGTQSNACQLLTPSLATTIFDTGLQEGELFHRDSRSSCRYDANRNEDDVAPLVGLDLMDAGESPRIAQIPGYAGCEDRDSGDERKVVEAVPSLPDGRLLACHGGSEPFVSALQGMWVEWTVGDYTWWLYLVLNYATMGVAGESPGIMPHQDALVAAAEEIHGMIQQGVGLEEASP